MSGLTTPEVLLRAYMDGYFPMAESRIGEIYWHFPNPRAIFDIYNTKISRSTRNLMKKNEFKFKINESFRDVITHCSFREDTWISDEIIDLYTELHNRGYAHSVEVYNKEGVLVGGLYGVAIGGAFFGESMFNLVPNAAKLAFAFLLERLKQNKFLLLDSQYLNNFTEQLGAFNITADEYLRLLRIAINISTEFK